MNRSLQRFVVASIFAISLASCGGGSDGNSADIDDSPVTTIADIPGVSEGCEDVINLVGAAGQIMAGQVKSEDAKSTLEKFKNAVPDELSEYADTFVKAYGDWIQVLDEYSNDMTAVYADPEAMAKLEDLNSPEVEEAFNVIGDYVSDECGVGN
jgi:hypothetical protein